MTYYLKSEVMEHLGRMGYWTTSEQLRKYEAMGIVSFHRDSSGYRVCNKAMVNVLERIYLLKTLRVYSLKGIKRCVDNGTLFSKRNDNYIRDKMKKIIRTYDSELAKMCAVAE